MPVFSGRSTAGLLTLAVLAACKPSATQLVLFVESDATLADVSLFSVEVTGANNEREQYEWPRAAVARSIGILPPSGDPRSGIEIVVRGSGSKSMEARRSIARFIENEVIELYVCLEERCAEQSGCVERIEDLKAIDQDESERLFYLNCNPGAQVDAGVPAPDAEPTDAPPPPDAGEGPDLPDLPDRPLVPWTARIGGEGADLITDVVIDSRGDVIIGGALEGERGFIAAYKSDGTERWRVTLDGLEESRIWALALGNIGDLYVTGNIYSTVSVRGTPIEVGANVNMGMPGELVVLRFDIAGDTAVLTDHLVAFDHGYQSGRAIAVDQNNVVHVAGNYDSAFNIALQAVGHEGTTGQDIFWAELSQDLTACGRVHRLASVDTDAAEEMKASRFTESVFLAGEIKGDLFINGVAGPTLIGPDDVFVAKKELRRPDVVTARRAGSLASDDDPRIAIEPFGQLHLVAKYESSAAMHVDNLTFALNDEAVLDVQLDDSPPASVALSTVVATGNDVLARGVASFPNANEVVVGANYRGALTVGTSTHTSVSTILAYDVVMVILRGTEVQGSWAFGGAGEDDLTRVAASDSVIAMVGTFTDSISFPDAPTLESVGEADGFIYVVPYR